MKINGKQDEFKIEDIMKVAEENSIKNAKNIFKQAHDAISQWNNYAKDAGVEYDMIKHIKKTQRLYLSIK